MIPGNGPSAAAPSCDPLTMSQEENISWFHGKISRNSAEDLLREGGSEDGLFLVRESSTALGDYVLSLMHDGEAIHYQIRRHGEDAFFSIDEGPIIHGLEMLIEYYRQEPEGLSSTLRVMCKGQPPPAHCRIHGRTNLLHRATREGELKVVSELLKSGYRSIDAKNLDGQTALHMSSILGLDDILQRLLEANANVGIRDSQGFTPLHYTCQLNHFTTTRILIGQGNANVQARSSHGGWVPLHEAASRGYIDCIKVLLAFNAPCRPRTDEGATPYDLAVRNGHYESARLLENYQAPAAKTACNRWFHGNISREVAYKRLQEAEFSNGAYLVRCSLSKPGALVLTMAHNEHVYHFEIQNKGKFFFIDDGPYLESLEHVIVYYSQMADGLPTTLVKPLTPGPETSQLEINNSLRSLSRTPSPNNAISIKDINQNHVPAPPVEYIRKESLKLLAEAIGEGEFGSVRKGIWTDLRSNTELEVAVKILRLEHIQTARDGFLREASVMIDLHHPCIVRLLGLCLGPPLMMVQELVPLGSLLDCLLDYPSSIDADVHLCMWAAQVAAGMLYLEEKRFVHRDLAARNILLTSLEQAKISDFGLSRALGAGHEYYRASQGGRWPIKWYAPESVNYGTFSHASDVWSYGVTLWEMYTYGKTPYGDMTGAHVIQFLECRQRLNRPDRCPGTVYDLMLRCWTYQPERRPTFQQLQAFFEENNTEDSSQTHEQQIEVPSGKSLT